MRFLGPSAIMRSLSTTTTASPPTGFFARIRDQHPRKYGIFRFGLRLTRTLAAAFGIFGTGVAYGIITYSWNPDATTNQIVQELVSQRSGQDGEPFLAEDSAEHRRVTHVVRRVLVSAKELVREHVSRSENEADQDAPPDPNLPQMKAEDWREALRRLESGEWHIHVLNDDTPNAFVHTLIPRHIFVHKGLLNKTFCESDDTLAFVLGHELGHCLLQHGVRTAQFEAAVGMLILVLLTSLDPTGTLSLGVEAFAPSIINLFARLPNSRAHEAEADALGMEISAKACYDPEGGATFFHALKENEAGAAAWLSTHPLPSTREEWVHRASHDKAIVSFHDHCIDVTATLRKSLENAKPRSSPRSVASPLSHDRVEYVCTNETRDATIDMYWAGYNGELQLWTSLAPGETAKCAPLAGASFIAVTPDSHEVRAELRADIPKKSQQGAHRAGGVATTTSRIVHQPGEEVEVLSSDDRRWHLAQVLANGTAGSGKVPTTYTVQIAENGVKLGEVPGSALRRHHGFEGERRKECRTF